MNEDRDNERSNPRRVAELLLIAQRYTRHRRGREGKRENSRDVREADPEIAREIYNRAANSIVNLRSLKINQTGARFTRARLVLTTDLLLLICAGERSASNRSSASAYCAREGAYRYHSVSQFIIM